MPFLQPNPYMDTRTLERYVPVTTKEKWVKWRTRPEKLTPEQKTRLNKLKQKARLEGKPFDAKMRVKAGLPAYIPKYKPWAQLTPREKERSLEASREHEERQRVMGVPEELIYGPVAVLERGKRWWFDTSSTLGRGDHNESP